MAAWSESQESGGVLVNVAAVPDTHLRVFGDDVYVPVLSNLAGYEFMGVTITLAQIDSPTLRVQTLIDVQPCDLVDEPASPPAFHDLFGTPVPLTAGETMRCLAAEGIAGAERETALCWFSDGPVTPVTGKIQTVRAAGTTTLTANAWTAVPLTFSQTLPVGSYNIVGARFLSTGARAGRIIVPGYAWRPGAPGCDAIGDLDVDRFRYGQAGVWATFATDNPPQAEFFSASADTAETVWLDLIKTA